MSDKPVAREIYDRLAEQLGPPLAELAASDRLAEAIEVADAVRLRAGGELQRSSRRFLHAWNLPAGSDVAVLRQEIGSLERAVRTLTRQVEELQRRLDETADEPASPTTAKAKSRATAKSKAKAKAKSKATAKRKAKAKAKSTNRSTSARRTAKGS